MRRDWKGDELLLSPAWHMPAGCGPGRNGSSEDKRHPFYKYLPNRAPRKGSCAGLGVGCGKQIMTYSETAG